MQFNEKLKRLRKERGMTQAELAEKVIISRSAVAKWENGLGLPNEQSLKLLADCFGVEPSELLSDPATETVIVNKNGTLSRQKVWIVVLAAFLAIATVLTGILVMLNGQTGSAHIPVVTHELIFETEQYLQTDTIPKYDYNDLNAECEYAPSRSFAMEWESTMTYLPILLIRTSTDGMISYEEVDYDSVNFKVKGDEIFLRKDGRGLCAGPASFDLRFFEGYANIEYEEMTVSIKIYNVPLRVQTVEPYFTDFLKEIPLTGSKSICADITPYNASFRKVTWNLEKIQFPDGTIKEDALEEFAAVVNVAETSHSSEYQLTTTEKAPIGAKIYITATADGVTSKPLVAEVVRIPVERIYLSINECFDGTVMFGSVSEVSLSLYPENATANILNEKSTLTLLTPEIAVLEESETGWTLRVTDDLSAWSEDVVIEAETSDGVTKKFYWSITGIRPESVTLLNAETGEELDDTVYLTHGSNLRLKAVVLPEDAHYDEVSFASFSYTSNYGAYVKLSDDGVITVEKNAPIGLDVMIGANTKHARSKTHHIVIEKVPVGSVTLGIETTEINKGTAYFLKREVFPANADYDLSSVKYHYLEEIEGILHNGNSFLVTTAPGGTVFHVQVEIDGVKSNILELTVMENPLEQLEISLGTDMVSSWQIYELEVKTNPSFADYDNLTFVLLDEIDGIYLSGNKLFIAPEVKSGTVFRIQAVADGIESNILTLTVVGEEEATSSVDSLSGAPTVASYRKRL